jgi:adenylosuccinate synthase
VKRLAGGYQKRFGELFKYDIKAELACFEEYREMMRKYVVDGVSFMTSAQQSDIKIVVEGANVMFSSQTLNKQCLLTSIGTDARY